LNVKRYKSDTGINYIVKKERESLKESQNCGTEHQKSLEDLVWQSWSSNLIKSLRKWRLESTPHQSQVLALREDDIVVETE